MRVIARPIDFSRSGPYFAGLFLVALVAFWPTYLSIAPSASSAYTHLHAVTAAAWMLMLVAQPLAIRARRIRLHRLIGQTSYVLAPLMLVTIVLLAHSRIRGLEGEAYGSPDLHSLLATVAGRVVRNRLRTGDILAPSYGAARALHGVHSVDAN